MSSGVLIKLSMAGTSMLSYITVKKNIHSVGYAKLTPYILFLFGQTRYMQRGAEAVHSANPEILAILSGLDYDKDLSFLSMKQVELAFTDKLVFELHWYGFSDGQDWQNGNSNEACGNATSNFIQKGGFLLKDGWPLFLSEFGVDVMGNSLADNLFLSCFLSVAAELDLDWAIWALQGSYYRREGQLDFDETYGVLSRDWSKARNERFVYRLAGVQKPFQGIFTMSVRLKCMK